MITTAQRTLLKWVDAQGETAKLLDFYAMAKNSSGQIAKERMAYGLWLRGLLNVSAGWNAPGYIPGRATVFLTHEGKQAIA